MAFLLEDMENHITFDSKQNLHYWKDRIYLRVLDTQHNQYDKDLYFLLMSFLRYLAGYCCKQYDGSNEPWSDPHKVICMFLHCIL